MKFSIKVNVKNFHEILMQAKIHKILHQQASVNFSQMQNKL